MIAKTFKYRLYPTKAQRSELRRWLGICRWVYNKTLEIRKKTWEEDQETLSLYDTHLLLTVWKEKEPWLRAVDAQVLQNTQRRVDLAFQGFFRRVRQGSTPGYPRFRNRFRYDSFCFPQYTKGCVLEASILKIYKIGEIRLNLHRPVIGQIKTTTIKVTATNKWFVCFSTEIEISESLPPSKKVIGLDLGLENFATANNGKVIRNPRFFREEKKELARAQRALSAAPKGTAERAKRRKVVARIHERIRNRRSNFAHKVSRALVNRFGTICMEDLRPSRMVHNHCLALSISDASWALLITYLTYKAEEAGRNLVLVNPAYTSQDCSGCGHREKKKKKLSQRKHSCKKCGLKLHRDHNAALNILRLGLQSLAVAKKPRRKTRSSHYAEQSYT